MSRKRVVGALIILMAVALGTVLGRIAFQVYQQQTFFALQREGSEVIFTMKPLRPDHVTPKAWDDTVGFVHTVWVNTIYSWNSISNSRLRQAIQELRDLFEGATAADSPERLDQVFDLLLRYRPEKERYIEGMRETYHGLSQFDPARESPP